jgi:tRNA A-37 threonylcarbamoyl transferase component Bud32
MTRNHQLHHHFEKFSKLEASDLRSRADDIKQALDRFHCAGFSHGDVGPSNIMTKDGRITYLSSSGPSFSLERTAR